MTDLQQKEQTERKLSFYCVENVNLREQLWIMFILALCGWLTVAGFIICIVSGII